jgi:hypothetical protein
MPATGDRSAHECPECGEPMYWAPAVVGDPDLLARTGRSRKSTGGSVDAYRCASEWPHEPRMPSLRQLRYLRVGRH